MNNLKVLRLSIQDEIVKLKLLDKEKDGLLKRRPSNYVLRAGGSILHDFYTGIEKIFEDIAKEIDQRVPMGEEWYSELLHQMTLDIPGLRPPVITTQTERKLREYLGFRHLFRKRYGFELDWERMKRLLIRIPEVLSPLEKEIETLFKTLGSAIANLK
ncbi:MAG: hypothetical protein HXY46_16455 [Syntrophaceae bacterium]|nr:hypothetical protein [Syntrophaceae bacterium]